MATNLRTVFIGPGQVAAGAGDSDPQHSYYDSYQDFFDDIGVGLPSDWTTADEDYLVLLYGDFLSAHSVTGLHRFDTKVTDATGITITFKPATGHSFWENFDPATEALTYYGPSKGVTIQINGWSSFCGSGTVGLGLKTVIDPGFQFYLNQYGSLVSSGNTGVENNMAGCLVWDARSSNFSEAFRTSSAGVEIAAVENNLFFLNGGRAVNSGSLSNASRIGGNTIILKGATTTSDAIYTDHGVNASSKFFYNNVVMGYTSCYSNNNTSQVAAFITDATAADNPDLVGSTNTAFEVSASSVFETWPATPSTAIAADFDLRLKAGSPAIGVGVFATGQPDSDPEGNDRSASGFDAGVLEYTTSGTSWAETATKGTVIATGNVGAMQASSNMSLAAIKGSADATGRAGAISAGVGLNLQALRGGVVAAGRVAQVATGVGFTALGAKGTIAAVGRPGGLTAGKSWVGVAVKGITLATGRTATVLTGKSITLTGTKGEAAVTGREASLNIGGGISLAAVRGAVLAIGRAGNVTASKSVSLTAVKGTAIVSGRGSILTVGKSISLTGQKGAITAVGNAGSVSYGSSIGWSGAGVKGAAVVSGRSAQISFGKSFTVLGVKGAIDAAGRAGVAAANSNTAISGIRGAAIVSGRAGILDLRGTTIANDRRVFVPYNVPKTRITKLSADSRTISISA